MKCEMYRIMSNYPIGKLGVKAMNIVNKWGRRRTGTPMRDAWHTERRERAGRVERERERERCEREKHETIFRFRLAISLTLFHRISFSMFELILLAPSNVRVSPNRLLDYNIAKLCSVGL